MIIEFRSADRMLGIKALGIYEKGIDAATAACDKVYVPTLALQESRASSEAAGEWVIQHLEDMGVGESRDLDMPHDLALTLRTASSVYMGQLSKLTEKQTDLLVPIEDTNDLISQLQSLADRLNGQTELRSMLGVDGLNASISINGGPEMPIAEFEQRADAFVGGILRERR